MNILGIDIDDLTRDEISGKVDEFLCEEKFHRIATVNPEFLVEADRNPVFFESIRSADLHVADGSGIVLAGVLKGERVHRYPGADLMEDILAKAERHGHGVFLAVRSDGLSAYEEIRAAIAKRYPRVDISGKGYSIDDFRFPSHSQEAHSEIDNHKSKIVFCNFGAPEQELFLDSLKDEPGSIRLAMGVGGSFDFLTGKRKRAPKWMRAVGLEWLWRLLLQPKRFTRIWNATGVFLWKVLFDRRQLREKTGKEYSKGH